MSDSTTSRDDPGSGEDKQPECSRCGDQAVVKGEAWYPDYGTYVVYACMQHSGQIAITGSVSGGGCGV